MTPDLEEKLRLWRQEHGAPGPLAIPTGTSEPPPALPADYSPQFTGSIPGTRPVQPPSDLETFLREHLIPKEGSFSLGAGRFAREVGQEALGNVGRILSPLASLDERLREAGLPTSEDVAMATGFGVPVGSIMGTAGRGVATQLGAGATATLGRAAPVARKLATGEVGAVGKAGEKVPFNMTSKGKQPMTKAQEAKKLDEDLAAFQAQQEAKTVGDIPKSNLETEATFVARRMRELTSDAKAAGFPLAKSWQRTQLQKEYRAAVALGPAAKAAQATEGVAPKVSANLIESKKLTPAQAKKAAQEEAAYQTEQAAFRQAAGTPKAPVEAKTVSESVQPSVQSPAPSTGATAAAESRVRPPVPGSAVPPAKPPIEPPVTTGAVPPGEPPFAANIRLSKYPDDLRSTIKEWADANPEAVQTARRGTRSDVQVLEDAKSLVDEFGGDFARLQRRWKAGDAWNAEEITAIRGTLRSKTQAVVDAAKVAADADSSANQIRLLTALEEQARVQEIVHGITAESGRALRAFRQQAFDALQSNDTAKMEELLKRLGGRAKTAEVAKALRDLDMNNPAAVNDFIRTIMKPKAMDYLTEIYYNSILSGPKTHIINGLSNMITTALSPVERGVAAVVERGLAPLQGRQVERFFSEVPADTIGAIQGIQEGLQNAAYTLKNGFSPAQASKWEFRPRAFQGTIGRVINAPSTALEAADALNRSINYRAAFNASVIRQAKKEGWTGQELLNRIADLKASPSVGILKEADRIAEYRLFRQEPGEVMAKFMALRDSYPAFRFVVPFIRTPGNLLKFGLERTPAGLFNPKLWRNIAGKNPEASDQIGRIFLGSSVAAYFAWQIAEGNLDITGAAPSSAAERDRFYREGKQPFAVRVGDTWIQFQRVEPLNQSLSQVAAVAEATRDKDSTAEEKASHAVLTIGENLVSQTYAKSIADLINALSQPERYGGQYLTRQLTGLVPASSALRTGAQLADTTVRKPGNLGESIEVGIPGASRNVPPSLTAFGEEVKRQSPPISPILFSQAKESPVDTELARLGIEVGFIGDSIEGIKLSREQRQRYQEVAGQLVKIALDSLVQSTQYKVTTDAAKEKGLTHVIDSARDKARAQIKQEFGLRKGMTPQNQPARGATPVPTATPQTTTDSRLEQWRREHATPVPAGAR